jgi:hypothetical protein
VPLGTNALAPGTRLHDPRSEHEIGTVLEISTAYEFDDGKFRPGVLVKAANGAEVWTPRTNVSKVLVLQ